LPPGVTIDAGVVFPVGWSAGDALPAGVTISPGAVFPPGWTPGDPLPPGVTIDAGAIVPAGWSPTNPPPNWFAPGGAGLQVPPGELCLRCICRQGCKVHRMCPYLNRPESLQQ